MNFSSSLKKIICLLLAAIMLLTVIACGDSGTKKKKKVVKKKVVVVKPAEDDDDTTSDIEIEDPSDDNSDDNNTDDENSEEGKVLPERPLPSAATVEGGYVHVEDPIIQEFDYEYTNLNITSDYVIVYAFENWENRLESRNQDGSDRYISKTGFARLSALDLQTYFKDKLNLKLEVKKDTEVAADAKKILVGDTAYYTSNLGDKEFAVKVKGDAGNAGRLCLFYRSRK